MLTPTGLYSIGISVPRGTVSINGIDHSPPAWAHMPSVEFSYVKLSFTPQHESVKVNMAGSMGTYHCQSRMRDVPAVPVQLGALVRPGPCDKNAVSYTNRRKRNFFIGVSKA